MKLAPSPRQNTLLSPPNKASIEENYAIAQAEDSLNDRNIGGARLAIYIKLSLVFYRTSEYKYYKWNLAISIYYFLCV